ncbi:MAG: peptidase M50, partial [Chloroflexota bacterium]
MRSLTLGQLHGIDVRVHPTFALVLVWIIYHWGIVEGGGIFSIAYGMLLCGFVFAFVLLHEFGHSLMALHYGIRVRDITLVPFGGVARVEHIPTRPGIEALIAIAGPAINVALAMLLLPLLTFTGIVRGFDSIGDFLEDLNQIAPSGLLSYLFVANVMIVAFNLLPAFPMDGGRLLRAGLSTILTREEATRIAVALGVIVSIGIATLGLWWQDYVLPLIAIFVVIAAYAEGRVVRLEEAMRRLRVGQFAVWDRGGVEEDDLLSYALRGGPRDVVVTRDGRVVGMVWRSELLRVLHGDADHVTAGEAMDPN